MLFTGRGLILADGAMLSECHVWRPHLGRLPFLGIPHSMLIRIADAQNWNKKTYNNAISALRRAFAFGYLDYPERRDPACP
jgi:sugar lactone lactonase YvrE